MCHSSLCSACTIFRWLPFWSVERSGETIGSFGTTLMRIFNNSQVQRQFPTPHCDGRLSVVMPVTMRWQHCSSHSETKFIVVQQHHRVAQRKEVFLGGFEGEDCKNTRNRILHCEGFFASEDSIILLCFCSVSFLGFFVQNVVEWIA